MDTQQSRHVVLKDTPSDVVTPPVLPVQMPATQTLHDQATVLPPIVTPVTIIEDPRSRMDRLKQRIRQMRDPDEMISWDDPDDVPVATLPVDFRMPDIERYMGVGCPRIHLRLYSTVMRALGLDEAQLLTLFPLSLNGMTQRWYASLETSRQRTWKDLAQEFLRQYSFNGVIRALHDFRSLVQALFDVDDGISRGLWSDIIPSLDTEGKGVGGSSESYGDVCSADFQHRRPGYHPYARLLQIPKNDFPSLQHRHPHSFQRPQTSIPRQEQSRPHRRHHRLILIWGCLWMELLSYSDLLMVGHHTDYCASLRHTIQDLINSVLLAFLLITTQKGLFDSFNLITKAIQDGGELFGIHDREVNNPNASNGSQIGVEMKKLEPMEADHSKLKANFAGLRNQPSAAK
ncbi:hypothetical protein CK203_107308 [Vitis vinifera]|uniref:Retrotransposon gag domain-containing protein n=1 Tax=Vitis vinifera TaxID=29760 RepID=A0A438CVS2_VITVI|nr:hypothetical protein CK203_107308 [Vitis vinifera]